MKAKLNLRLATASLIVALFTGCAGITEANLDTDTQALDAPAVSADAPVQSADAPGYFHSGDEEDIIDVRPSNGYDDRE
ncbi:hypothetical protein [Rhodohalobacter sp. 614A]|uniref:hypothetical protein n=1 Tax=Rhodohalobacter sp. 614A TaxID=2908649 RepID=UPI001F38570B|nr:hypothetical protein [Rhodohalobacter sp. 614A]